jgi:hypothetical protein
MTTGRTTLRLPALLAAAVAFAVPHMAQAAVADPFSGLPSLGSQELGSLRGGMTINGIPVDFAVTIRTAIDTAMNSAALETRLTFDDSGHMSQTSSVTGTPNAVVSGPDTIGLMLAGGATRMIQEITDAQVRTLISNSASNVNITRATQLDVHMPGFMGVQQNWVAGLQAARIGVEAALLGLR